MELNLDDFSTWLVPLQVVILWHVGYVYSCLTIAVYETLPGLSPGN